jgi:hypothetical protein
LPASALDGFYIAKGEPDGREEGAPVAAADLRRLPFGALGRARGKTG